MYRGLRGSMGTLDDANPTRLSKRHQMSPYRDFRVTGRDRTGGNLATNKGKGQVETVLGSAEGAERDMD